MKQYVLDVGSFMEYLIKNNVFHAVDLCVRNVQENMRLLI